MKGVRVAGYAGLVLPTFVSISCPAMPPLPERGRVTNPPLPDGNASTKATVVPAKAGIQEILREKRVPATEGSGFRLSPERRVYGAIALARCRGWFPSGYSPHLLALPPGRGGFVTRPTFKGQDRPINRFAIVEPFLRSGQGGFETRPYPDESIILSGQSHFNYGNPSNHPRQPSFRRKPESRKSSSKSASRLPKVLDSGFRRNDGFMVRLPWQGVGAGYPSGYSPPLLVSPPGRGGFVTRPTFNDQDRPVNRWS